MNIKYAIEHAQRAYRQLVSDGYHRPNETIVDLETALSALGVSLEKIDELYEETSR